MTWLMVCSLKNFSKKVSIKLIGASNAIIWLPVNLPQYDIQRTNYRHHICHQVANAHLPQGLQVDHRRRSHAYAPWLSCAVGDQIASDLALWPFNRMIVITDWRFYHPQDIWILRAAPE